MYQRTLRYFNFILPCICLNLFQLNLLFTWQTSHQKSSTYLCTPPVFSFVCLVILVSFLNFLFIYFLIFSLIFYLFFIFTYLNFLYIYRFLPKYSIPLYLNHLLILDCCLLNIWTLFLLLKISCSFLMNLLS